MPRLPRKRSWASSASSKLKCLQSRLGALLEEAEVETEREEEAEASEEEAEKEEEAEATEEEADK